MKLDGEICVLWFHTLLSQTLFYAGEKIMQKRYATIWMKYIFVIFIGAQSK
jgi:hypothetical protein